jgi:hypothetical protein
MLASERLLLSRERLRQEMQRPRAGAVSTLAGVGVRALLLPAAKSHPLVLVGGAVAIGALVAWSRPWRLAAQPALLATLLPLLTQVISTRPGGQSGAGAAKKA